MEHRAEPAPAEADVVKVGLALFDGSRLLTVRKRGSDYFILPGGKLERGETDEAALRREVREELSCDLVDGSLRWIGVFSDEAADAPGTIVKVRLYAGRLLGRIRAASEIVETKWFDPSTDDHGRLAPSIRNQILPLLSSRGRGDSWRW
jgi:8-oxo-dGTP diphosphatase